MTGFLCTRCVPRTRALELAANAEPLKLGTLRLIGLTPWGAYGPNFSVSGWDCIYADWTSIRCIALQHASVLCNVSEEESGHKDSNPEDPYLRCPRSALHRAIQYALDQHQVSFLAGFELEFYLVEAEDVMETASFNTRHPKSFVYSAASMRDKYGRCVFDCARNVQASGIVVETFHPISAPRQYQITLGAIPVLSAVDAMVQAQ